MKPTYYQVMWHNCNRCRKHYTSEHPHLKAYLCDDCWNTIPHFVVQTPKIKRKIVKKQKEYTWSEIALYTIGNLICLGVIGYYLYFSDKI